MGGTVTTLAVMGFLVFLWTGEGSDQGKGSLSSWRFIILEQWISQAITLSSVVLSLTNTSQASICTGLIAAMVLEGHGIPLSQLAECSVIRSGNDGPLKLSWMLLVRCRKRPPALLLSLVLALLAGSIAAQFTSTILLTDLASSTIVANPGNDSIGVSATDNTLNQFHLVNEYFLQPTFSPFGEVPGSSAEPTEAGLSDTGIVKRIHPFVPQPNRTTLRDYRGQAFVFNSRVVCLPPSLEQIQLSSQLLDNPSFTLDFVPYLAGTISYNNSLESAGLGLPIDCPDANCFPSDFNCSIAVRTGIPGRPAVSGCVASGRNAVLPAVNSTISPDPIANTSEVFLFIRNNIVLDTDFESGTVYSPIVTSGSDEWTTFNFSNGVSIDMSICFQQLHYDRALVELFTAENLVDRTVKWDANTTHWDTSDVRKLFGIADNGTTLVTASARGIFSVESISNVTRSSTTKYLTDVMTTDSYDSFEVGNITILLSPYGGGNSEVFPHVEYQALFADTLQATNRPAVAFQTLITSLSGTIIDSILTQLDIEENVETVYSVSVLAPQRQLGLASVLSLTGINLLVVVMVCSLFLLRSQYTSQGSYWHSIAQIFSHITYAIIDQATESTDDEVTKMLKDHDVRVKLARVGNIGRVEVVTCEADSTR
ncbi:hypothetical protein BX600DRAFT_550195 [Xylariales sp. PMI_506]|nr:hypothetical protein BX600DRAFT_550195 [Xylariales sp. PMI_506]